MKRIDLEPRSAAVGGGGLSWTLNGCDILAMRGPACVEVEPDERPRLTVGGARRSAGYAEIADARGVISGHAYVETSCARFRLVDTWSSSL